MVAPAPVASRGRVEVWECWESLHALMGGALTLGGRVGKLLGLIVGGHTDDVGRSAGLFLVRVAQHSKGGVGALPSPTIVILPRTSSTRPPGPAAPLLARAPAR